MGKGWDRFWVFHGHIGNCINLVFGNYMILKITGELCDLNTYINAERGNRFHAAKIKKDETEKVYWACKEQKLKKVTGSVYMTYTWYCKNKRKDKDNIVFARKFIQDGLVEAKILTDDGWDEIEGFQDVFEIDAKNPRVEVEIT
jgi:hypothetical protein